MNETPVLEPHDAYALWAAEYPPHAHNPLMQAEERALLSLLPRDLGGKAVCDAGCGSGRYLLHAAARGARPLLGVDLSEAMLRRAREELARQLTPEDCAEIHLVQASLEALPLSDAWADITLCGLTLGHLPDLDAPLAELRRITRPGGMILCSDLHPVGQELGWQRTFKVAGERYAVRHTWHTRAVWEETCRRVGLRVRCTLEPHLAVVDIPRDARFDPRALKVPVVLVLELEREE
jgi:malonyl-CoA O-methyltransferase